MNIQIFNNLALPPPESLADTSPDKRAAEQAPEDEPSAKRSKLKEEEVAQDVTRLVEHSEVAEAHDTEPHPKRYKLSDDEVAEGVDRLVAHYRLEAAQKARLEAVAKLTRYTPTVREVEWVAKEAKLRDCGSELDVWIFAYMEYFPWYLRSQDEDHRLWTGAFRRYDGSVAYLWIGFETTAKSGTQSTLYLDGPQATNKSEDTFRPPYWTRCWVTWHAPLEMMFGLHANFPQDRTNEAKNRTAADHQDEILKAVMKVLARFPGLITELDDADSSKILRLYTKHSTKPFKNKEMLTPDNPLAKLFEVLCTESQESMPKSKTQTTPTKQDGAKKETTKIQAVFKADPVAKDSDEEMEDDEGNLEGTDDTVSEHLGDAI